MQNLAEIREMIQVEAKDLLALFDQFESILRLVHSSQEEVKYNARLKVAILWNNLVRELDAKEKRHISCRINTARAQAFTPAPPRVAAKASPAQNPAPAQAAPPKKQKTTPNPELSRSGVRNLQPRPMARAKVRVA